MPNRNVQNKNAQENNLNKDNGTLGRLLIQLLAEKNFRMYRLN